MAERETTAEPNPARQHARQAREAHGNDVRWVGSLFCTADFCNTVLAEVFADGENKTYLQPIGGRKVRHTAIPCPQCGQVRVFDTADVGPPPAPKVLLPPKLHV